MKGLRSIPRILKINEIDDYKVSCLFNNGQSRIIDFKALFEQTFKLKPNQTGYILTQDMELFKDLKIIGTTIGWENVGIESEDEDGNRIFYHYDLDPLVLYRNSIPDQKRDLIIGMMIKQARKEAGMTQEELAKKVVHPNIIYLVLKIINQTRITYLKKNSRSWFREKIKDRDKLSLF